MHNCNDSRYLLTVQAIQSALKFDLPVVFMVVFVFATFLSHCGVNNRYQCGVKKQQAHEYLHAPVLLVS